MEICYHDLLSRSSLLTDGIAGEAIVPVMTAVTGTSPATRSAMPSASATRAAGGAHATAAEPRVAASRAKPAHKLEASSAISTLVWSSCEIKRDRERDRARSARLFGAAGAQAAGEKRHGGESGEEG